MEGSQLVQTFLNVYIITTFICNCLGTDNLDLKGFLIVCLLDFILISSLISLAILFFLQEMKYFLLMRLGKRKLFVPSANVDRH